MAAVDIGAHIVAAHMFVFYYGVLSSITPPVALAAYGASSVSGADPLRTAVTACRLGITAFIVPFLFVYYPELLLLEGSVWEVAGRLAICTFGVWLLSMAAIGHGLTAMSGAARLIAGLSALLLFVDFAVLNAIGAGVGAAVVLLQLRSAKARSRKAVEPTAVASSGAEGNRRTKP